MIALGGWTGSGHFSDVAASPERRERLVGSAVDLFMVAYGDVDRSVEDYLGASAPPDRIVFGLLFYGRAFGGVGPGPPEMPSANPVTCTRGVL